MGFRLEKIEHGLSRFNAQVREIREQGRPPRDLLNSDTALFDRAAYERPPSQSKQRIMADIALSNPVRMHRLQREYKWLQKQLRKRGLNPEDARYLL